MNRVYKVIWSKAKHCYVVTSEIARSVTKSASSARSAGRKGAAVLAMAALLFTAGGVLGEAANVTDVKPGSTADVIMVTKDDGTTTPITINDVYHAMKANSDGDGLIINENYVKNADARVSTDGEYVKKDKKVGENLSALDAQVKKNTDAVAAEETARKTADQNNLKVGDDGVISKVTGDDGTTSSAVNTLVLNKDGKNQITLSEDGIKVGKNSTTMDEKGIYAGSDYDYGTAKAALDATEGKIRGADGNFQVNADGKVTAKGGVDTDGREILTHNGNINAGSGDISGKNISASGNLHADGDISGKDISGKDITGSGTVRGRVVTDGTASMEGGKVQGTSVSDGVATLSGGSLTDAVNITASGTITGNDVVVKGKLTTTGLETDRITLGSETPNQTDIYQGNVTSKVNETVSGVEYTAESIFNKDGSSITARTDVGEHADSTGKSIVGAKKISQYLGDAAEPDASQKNVTRSMVRNDDGTFSMEDKAVDGTKSSTVSQNAGERKVTVTDGTKTLTVTKNLTDGIVSETNDGAGKTVTLTQGMDGTYKVVTSGTSTEEIGGKKIENYNGGLATEITGDETHHVTKNQTITVTGKSSLSAADIENKASSSIWNHVGEGYNTSWKMTDRKISESIVNGTASNKENTTAEGTKRIITSEEGTGTYNQTATSNNISLKNKAEGTSFTKSESLLDGEKTSVTNLNGSSTINQSAESIVNFVKNSKGHTTRTEQSAEDITNIAKDGTITNNANNVLNKGANSVINEVGANQVAVMTDSVKATYGSDTYTTWNGNGITNNAKDKTVATNAKDLVNTASNSITDKVGENVERTMGTKKIEESVKDGTKSNTFTKTAKKDMNIITDGTNTSTLSQLADKVNTSLKEVDGAGNTTKSLNNVKTVSEDTTKMTDAASGEFSKRSQTVSQIQDKVGKTTVTTIDGKTKLTDEDHNHTTEMDYANVTKDLSVERDTTLGKKGEHTNLTVNSKSEFKDTVKMDSTLEVDGTSKFNDKVTITKNGLDVKDGTTTDTLTVTGTSEFADRADFRKDVYMWGNLEVTGETRTDTLYVDHDGYVGGNLNVAGNIETHDAVLSADSRQVVTGRQLYQTNERVDRLDNRIKKVGANAAALAALRPGDFNPDDKFSIAAGFGSYRNANAAALGLFYRPNENVLLSLGTSFGDGENMVNAGVSVKFGRGKSMAERRKEMADEVSSMRDEMRSQDERIAELEEMLKKQSELIEKLSKES